MIPIQSRAERNIPNLESFRSQKILNKQSSIQDPNLKLKLPQLLKSSLKTQSSIGLSPRKTERQETSQAENSEVDDLPTLEEMASKFNYMKNLQPYLMMDRDLGYLVEDLKTKKKSRVFKTNLDR